jgi:hypothetical protein
MCRSFSRNVSFRPSRISFTIPFSQGVSARLTTIKSQLFLFGDFHVHFQVSRGRYADINEINQFQNNTLGTMVGRTLPRQGYVFQMIPTAPTPAQLANGFTIAATGSGPDGTPNIFMTDQAGVISQISP